MTRRSGESPARLPTRLGPWTVMVSTVVPVFVAPAPSIACPSATRFVAAARNVAGATIVSAIAIGRAADLNSLDMASSYGRTITVPVVHGHAIDGATATHWNRGGVPVINAEM